MEFDNNQPVWLQLLGEFKRKIALGTWAPGQKIDSVRDLAHEFGVNPNTIQRALTELDRSGFTASERTTGRFVTALASATERAKDDLAIAAADAFITQALSLRLTYEQTQALIEDRWGDERTKHGAR